MLTGDPLSSLLLNRSFTVKSDISENEIPKFLLCKLWSVNLNTKKYILPPSTIFDLCSFTSSHYKEEINMEWLFCK